MMPENTILTSPHFTLLTQLSSFQLGKLGLFLVDTSEVKQSEEVKVNLAKTGLTSSLLRTHCGWQGDADEEERFSPNGCQAELGKGEVAT